MALVYHFNDKLIRIIIRGELIMIAVYPGTFDPFTRGHEDLVRRTAGIFDTLIVGVADSRNKSPFFSLDERFSMACEVLAVYPNVQVESFTGLLKDFVYQHQARVVVRGLRAVSDFEYEFQLAGMNRCLMPDIDMMFMTPAEQYQFISGKMVREIVQLGGDAGKFVAPFVEARLKDKVAQLLG
jgi:pantetheine-phosphate adenylyltransferase